MHFWAHSESFRPSSRDSEIAWIRSYAEEWKKVGAQVTFGHSLESEIPKNCILQIFGAGHWESLHWLAPLTQEIWLSPFSFSAPTAKVAAPESRSARLLKAGWRKLRNTRSPALDDHTCLALPKRFLIPDAVLPQLLSWGVPRNKIITGDRPAAFTELLK